MPVFTVCSDVDTATVWNSSTGALRILRERVNLGNLADSLLKYLGVVLIERYHMRGDKLVSPYFQDASRLIPR